MTHVACVAVIAASGHYEAPLSFAVPIIAVVLIAKFVLARKRGRPLVAGSVLVRCRKGHVFKTSWSPLGSLTSVRLGSARFQRCPVGEHWSLVKPVRAGELTDEERRRAEEYRDPTL